MKSIAHTHTTLYFLCENVYTISNRFVSISGPNMQNTLRGARAEPKTIEMRAIDAGETIWGADGGGKGESSAVFVWRRTTPMGHTNHQHIVNHTTLR